MAPLSREQEEMIEKAYRFAEEAHRDHTRLSGDPYFIHLYETAKSLAELGMGPNTVIAGLLHDSIEDVGVTPETIQQEFSREVLFLVEGVTKLGALKYRGAQRHVESLRKLFVATSQDVRVIIIKLMDRLHNMKTLEHVRPEKRARIALETLEIYAPIADRLGIGKLKRDLEDLAFPWVYPQEYEEIKKLMDERKVKALRTMNGVQQKLRKELVKSGITNFRTDSRIKGLYSLWRKLDRKEGDIEKIYDLAALRVLVPTVGDCYRVLGVVHGLWRPLPGKIKDYIAFPKPNGYQSLHTTIFSGDGGIVEIQIRTEEMHREAQWGIASHIAYKQQSEGRSVVPQTFLWLRSLIPGLRATPPSPLSHAAQFSEAHAEDVPKWIKEIAQEQEHAYSDEGDFLKRLKGDFFSHRVFVFTPKGDVIDLPIDSSPIDFAYAIHSDVGNHIAGAKVNGKLVSLDTKLKNGDIVQIETKNSSAPSSKWLEHTRTSMARKHIQQALSRKDAERRIMQPQNPKRKVDR